MSKRIEVKIEFVISRFLSVRDDIFQADDFVNSKEIFI